MTPRERLDRVFALEVPDRTPILGGWIACPPHILELAGATDAEYAADPFGVSVRAYRELGSDGLLAMFIPRAGSDYRCVDQDTYLRADSGRSFEQVCAEVDALPEPEAVEAAFDFDAAYELYRADWLHHQERCGELVWMPAQWGAGAHITLYGHYGYENWYMLFADPRRAQRMIECWSAHAYCRARLLARLIDEGLFPKAVLLGEDICDQRGPMVRVELIERYYAPCLRRSLDLLRAVGARPVWHSDGNIMPLVDMLLDCGICGFQGFQPECGVHLEKLVERRNREGEPLLFFGPLAVTTELPRMTPAQVIARCHEAIEICRGRAGLVLFTSNTICPDVPLANIRAMHEAARSAPAPGPIA